MGTLIGSTVSNIYAKPQVIKDKGYHGATCYVIKQTMEAAVGDVDNADIIHMVPLPWEARIHRIDLHYDSTGATATADVGLYKMTKDGTFTVLDVDAYGSAVNIAAANVVGNNVAFEARDINKMNQRVIEDAGLTAIPANNELAILSLTYTSSATPAAGTISVVVHYTLGG